MKAIALHHFGGPEVLTLEQLTRKDSVEYGTYAELVTVADHAVAHKPATLSFAQAGALPLAGLTALQALEAVAVGPGPAASGLRSEATREGVASGDTGPRERSERQGFGTGHVRGKLVLSG